MIPAFRSVFYAARRFAAGLAPALLMGMVANTTPARADQLLVSDYNHDQVRVYDVSTGTFLYSLGDPSNDGISGLRGITIGPDGVLYVLSQGNRRVLTYDLTQHSFRNLYGTFTNDPYQSLFDSMGHLLVSTDYHIDADNGSGVFTDLLSSDSNVALSPGYPEDFAIGPDGYLYVVNTRDADVRRYTRDGKSVDKDGNGKPTYFIAAGTAGIGTLEGLAFGPDGNLYISDYSSDRVVQYNFATKAIVSYLTGSGLHRPTRLRFGPNGDIYVISRPVSGGTQILEFQGPTGKKPSKFVKAAVTEDNLALIYLTFTKRGDFNADGQPDLLWQDTNTGAAYVWQMSGAAYTGKVTQVAGAIGTQWRVAATSDFSANGNTNLLWRNTTTGDLAFWQMSGTTLDNAGSLAAAVPLNWQIVGTGDFNGDGYPDIVWQDNNTGQVAVWYLQGTSYIGSATLTNGVAGWRVAAIEDFNHDGSPDLLWRNTTTGDVLVWFMQKTTYAGASSIAGGIALAWQIAGTGDFNGDGYPDIVWQNQTTGESYVWYMVGSTLTGTARLASGIPGNYRLVSNH